MAALQNKVQSALDEARILVLGAQVLLGFEFHAFLESGFEKLPPLTQRLQIAALFLLIFVLSLLIASISYHRIVEHGNDSARVHRVIGRVMGWVLAALAIVIGIAVFTVAERVLGGRIAAWTAGAGATSVALVLFYGYTLTVRVRRRHSGRREDDMSKEQSMEPDLAHKIQHVLTETRVALPGVQALLGFQMAIVLMPSFATLPYVSKVVHLAAMGLNVFAMVLLMTPAAYHRIVERGEETDGFHRVATRFLLAALAPMALAISADAYVVFERASGSPALAVLAAGAAASCMLMLWLVLPLLVATRRRQSAPPALRTEANARA